MSTKQTAVIGLTDGIASGKSTVTRMFRERFTEVVDADQIAREVVSAGTPALEEISKQFGKSFILPDGELDRAQMGELIFSDVEARKRLEAITHPRIAQSTAARFSASSEGGIDWLIYDAALIVENGLHLGLDGLIVVSCTPETQRARIVARDDLSLEEAQARIDAQLPLADKVAVADWVIDNDGTLAHTEEQVEAIFQQLNQKFGERSDGKKD